MSLRPTRASACEDLLSRRRSTRLMSLTTIFGDGCTVLKPFDSYLRTASLALVSIFYARTLNNCPDSHKLANKSFSVTTRMMMLITSNQTASLRSSSAGSSWVQPLLPVQAESLPYSAIENLCARVYPSPTSFFPLEPSDDPLQHYAHLARGLSRVFNQLPSLAGRLRQNARGASTIEFPTTPETSARF